MAEAGSPRRIRSRRWKIVVASSVAGMVLLGGGVALWRGPGVIPNGGGNGLCGTISPKQTLVAGFPIDNTAQSTIELETVRFVRKTNMNIVNVSAVDRSEGGIGADMLPDADPETIALLHGSRPISGYRVPGKHTVEIILQLRRENRGPRGILREMDFTYREDGKPFEYSASVSATFVVASDAKKCGRF